MLIGWARSRQVQVGDRFLTEAVADARTVDRADARTVDRTFLDLGAAGRDRGPPPRGMRRLGSHHLDALERGLP